MTCRRPGMGSFRRDTMLTKKDMRPGNDVTENDAAANPMPNGAPGAYAYAGEPHYSRPAGDCRAVGRYKRVATGAATRDRYGE